MELPSSGAMASYPPSSIPPSSVNGDVVLARSAKASRRINGSAHRLPVATRIPGCTTLAACSAVTTLALLDTLLPR